MINRDRPTANADTTLSGTPDRAGRYREAHVLPLTNKEMFACDEGSYYVAITPTAGTGIIGHAAPTTFDETKPYITLYNGGTNRIYPQFLTLHCTVVGVAEVRTQFTVAADIGNRRSSGGTALVINNTNLDSSNTESNVQGWVGAITAAAATGSRRLLGHYPVRGTIDVVEDQYHFVWGSAAGPSYSSRAATVSDIARFLPPMCIGPGHTLLIHQWAGSQSTGPTFEVVFGFIAR